MKINLKDCNIRLGTPNDIYQIAEVYAASIRQLCSNDYCHKTIDKWAKSTPAHSRLQDINNGSLWVAEVDEKIIGYLVSVPGELLELFINPEYSGIGLGARLGELGIELAQQNHASPVLLESTINAAPFYEKLGFKEVSRGVFSHGESSFSIPVVNMVLSGVIKSKPVN